MPTPCWTLRTLVKGLGRIANQTSDFSSEVMGEVPLHDISSFRVGTEILVECSNLPAHGAQRFYCQRFHVGRNAAEDERGPYDVTRH